MQVSLGTEANPSDFWEELHLPAWAVESCEALLSFLAANEKPLDLRLCEYSLVISGDGNDSFEPVTVGRWQRAQLVAFQRRQRIRIRATRGTLQIFAALLRKDLDFHRKKLHVDQFALMCPGPCKCGRPRRVIGKDPHQYKAKNDCLGCHRADSARRSKANRLQQKKAKEQQKEAEGLLKNQPKVGSFHRTAVLWNPSCDADTKACNSRATCTCKGKKRRRSQGRGRCLNGAQCRRNACRHPPLNDALTGPDGYGLLWYPACQNLAAYGFSFS